MISGHSSALSCMLGPVVSCLRHFSIVMVQTSEDGKSYHLGSGLRSDTRWSSGVWNLLLDALMGSCLVEVGHIRLEDALELPLLEDEQVIEALMPHTAQEALTDRISARRMNRRFQYLDAAGCGHARETGRKFAIVISNQIFR